MTATASRHRLPWSMSETNRLYSEYELKQLPISNIAQLHARTEYAILHKLAQEFLINASWNDVKGWKAPKEMTQSKAVYDYEEDYESEYDNESDSDYDENEYKKECKKKSFVLDDESLEDCDDPNDSDYVPEEDDDDDDEDDEDDDDDDDDDSSDYEEEEEFDAYNIPQKVSSFRKLVDAAKFFIYAV